MLRLGSKFRMPRKTVFCRDEHQTYAAVGVAAFTFNLCVYMYVCCVVMTGADYLTTMGQRLHEDDSQVRLKVVFAGYDPHYHIPYCLSYIVFSVWIRLLCCSQHCLYIYYSDLISLCLSLSSEHVR